MNDRVFQSGSQIDAKSCVCHETVAGPNVDIDESVWPLSEDKCVNANVGRLRLSGASITDEPFRQPLYGFPDVHHIDTDDESVKYVAAIGCAGKLKFKFTGSVVEPRTALGEAKVFDSVKGVQAIHLRHTTEFCQTPFHIIGVLDDWLNNDLQFSSWGIAVSNCGGLEWECGSCLPTAGSFDSCRPEMVCWFGPMGLADTTQ